MKNANAMAMAILATAIVFYVVGRIHERIAMANNRIDRIAATDHLLERLRDDRISLKFKNEELRMELELCRKKLQE
jgi:hypothetical protein